jgi:hypothetical protein
VARSFGRNSHRQNQNRIAEIAGDVWSSLGEVSRWSCLLPELALDGRQGAARAAVAVMRAQDKDWGDTELVEAFRAALAESHGPRLPG